mgnify:CR=1 FL=1
MLLVARTVRIIFQWLEHNGKLLSMSNILPISIRKELITSNYPTLSLCGKEYKVRKESVAVAFLAAAPAGES